MRETLADYRAIDEQPKPPAQPDIRAEQRGDISPGSAGKARLQTNSPLLVPFAISKSWRSVARDCKISQAVYYHPVLVATQVQTPPFFCPRTRRTASGADLPQRRIALNAKQVLQSQGMLLWDV